MQYLGGKNRQARRIVHHITRLTDRRRLVEPFCGSCSITVEAVRQGFTVQASDVHPALIAMWKALQDGWTPATTAIDEQTYKAAKELPDDDPMKALIGFGASWGGKYFGGFARSTKNQDYLGGSYRSAAQKMAVMSQRVTFRAADYRSIVVEPGQVVYCDPPYAATTGYRGTSAFDHDEFWHWCRQAATICPVFVTEFTVPTDAQVIDALDRTVHADSTRVRDVAELLVAFGV